MGKIIVWFCFVTFLNDIQFVVYDVYRISNLVHLLSYQIKLRTYVDCDWCTWRAINSDISVLPLLSTFEHFMKNA